MDAIRDTEKKILMLGDGKNNPELLRQKIQDIENGMANLLTLASQSFHGDEFEKTFREMTEEKARLTERLQQAEKDLESEQIQHMKLDSILKSTDIDLIPPTEFDDFFIRRIVEQVTILSNEKIEVRFIGGFSKVGDIPKNEK